MVDSSATPRSPGAAASVSCNARSERGGALGAARRADDAAETAAERGHIVLGRVAEAEAEQGGHRTLLAHDHVESNHALRHARAWPGHPRLNASADKDVDGRDKPGHDGRDKENAV